MNSFSDLVFNLSQSAPSQVLWFASVDLPPEVVINEQSEISAATSAKVQLASKLRWSPQELEILEECITKKMQCQQIQKIIKQKCGTDRNVGSIQKKKERHFPLSMVSRWTPEEVDTIKTEWLAEKNDEEIAAIIQETFHKSRTPKAIHKKRWTCGFFNREKYIAQQNLSNSTTENTDPVLRRSLRPSAIFQEVIDRNPAFQSSQEATEIALRDLPSPIKENEDSVQINPAQSNILELFRDIADQELKEI